MSSVKALVVKSLMVVGKSLILAASIPAYASDITDPRFFEYRSSNPINRLYDLSFGWYKKLDDSQKEAYYQSITHAMEMAENGQRVQWYRGDASGFAVPVMTWPTGTGYCRRLHIQVIAYNKEKTMATTACFDNSSRKWQWVADK